MHSTVANSRRYFGTVPLFSIWAGFLGSSCLVLFPPIVKAEGDVTKGKQKYEQLCLSCHGVTGAGDGPTGKALPPTMKPRDLATGQMKFATDAAKFGELLSKGGAAVGLNPLMPAQAGISQEDIANLYAYIKSLKK